MGVEQQKQQQPEEKKPKLSEGNEQEEVIESLENSLKTHDDNRRAVQDKLHGFCDKLRAQIDELEERIDRELEEKFAFVDNKMQTALNELREENTTIALQKAKIELLVEQSYEIIENNLERQEDIIDLTTLCDLKTERRINSKWLEIRKPTNVHVTGAKGGNIFVQFTCLNPDEERILVDPAIVNPVRFKCMVFKTGNEEKDKKEYPLVRNEDDFSSFSFRPGSFEIGTAYSMKVKMVIGSIESVWSDEASVIPEFKGCCVWKECPDNVDNDRKYSVDEKNPRIAAKINNDNYCTIIGNTHIPLNTVTPWSAKIHKSKDNNGCHIYIGIAPSDINQNGYNGNKCGWYFNCYDSELHSGPPHKYRDKEYGPRKKKDVHTGDSVGVVVDTVNGELSFVLDNVNLGVAYKGIPLDKPLVPCVILYFEGDSIELDTSEVRKENEVNSSIHVPPNVKIKSKTWDSITLAWDKVEDASFYQIEMDGSNSGDATTENEFTKRKVIPEVEHSFRVRAVRGNSVSEWSGVVKGRPLKTPEFSECVWTGDSRSFSWGVYPTEYNENPKIATKNWGPKYHGCTFIGNALVPFSTVTSWSIKILKIKYKHFDRGTCIGVAPFDIDLKESDNYEKCGWYFNCYNSTLISGPPHNYNGREHGPRNFAKRSMYDGDINDGDIIRLTMDTIKGKLSFALNESYVGAYEGIPLDKPLVPCVILVWKHDSVELII